MVPVTRRRVLTVAAVVAAALLVASLGMYMFRDPVLDSSDAVDSALPAQKDMRGWSANRGVIGTLPPPEGDKDGKLVLTGGKLKEQCDVYRKKSNGWACDGLRGLGLIGYNYDENVFTRVSSMLLAYEDDDAAEAAWRTMTDRTRDEFKDAEEGGSPAVGDASRSFTLDAGTIVVLRSGSVIAQTMSSNEFGFARAADADADLGAGAGADEAEKDPIGMWASLQAEKAQKALEGK